MKLSKREKILLLFTFFIALGAAYYYFVFVKVADKLSILRTDVEQVQKVYDIQQELLLRGARLDNDIEILKHEIIPIASRYYGEAEQEDFISEIIKINKKSGVEIKKVSFSENKKFRIQEKKEDEAEAPNNKIENNSNDNSISTDANEQNISNGENVENDKKNEFDGKKLELVAVKEDVEQGLDGENESNTKLFPQMDLIEAEIEFDATYSQLIKWLNAVDKNPRIIVSRQLSAIGDKDMESSDKDIILKCKALISFYKIENVDKYIPSFVSFTKVKPIKKGNVENPFKPYKWAIIEKQMSEINSIEEILMSYYKTGNSESGSPYKKNINEADSYKNLYGFLRKSFLYDFEDGSIELKKSTNKIIANGEITNKNVSSGMAAGTVRFIFPGEGSDEKLFIDLSKKSIMLYEKADSVSFSLFATEEIPVEVGFIFLDKNNQEYQVTIASEINWRGWKDLTYDLSGLKNYPVTIKGIYVKNSNEGQKIESELIFDSISMNSLGKK
ncbi:MAG: hypothetical protein ACRDA4_05040 [Filifactoraceae bacterium]